MCYLLFKPAGQSIDLTWLENAYANGNQDGCGLAYVRNGKSYIYKTLDVNDYLAQCARVPDTVNAVFHLRMASTGEVCKSNCHPFAFGDLIGAHNGCIAGYGDSTTTDTEDFFRREVWDSATLSRHAQAIAAQLGWGKAVFLHAKTGAPTILHESKGQWSGGCWHSNDYFRPSRRGGFYGADFGDTPSRDEALENLLFALDEASATFPPADIARAISALRAQVETHLYSSLM